MAPKRSFPYEEPAEEVTQRPRRRSQFTEADRYGRETDPTVQQFGHLDEALHRNDATTANDLRTFRLRYRRRRNLALMAGLAEGESAVQSLEDGTRLRFLVLSPPGVAAVRHADSSWSRVPRREDIHGPAPYSEELYQQYLASAQLPAYFLNERHLQMHNGDREAVLLEVPDQASAPVTEGLDTMIVSDTETPYPRTYAQPVVVRGALADFQRIALANRYPALLLDTSTYEVVVQPSGHLFLRSARRDASDLLLGLLETYVNTEHLGWQTRVSGPAAFFEEAPATGNRLGEVANAYQLPVGQGLADLVVPTAAQRTQAGEQARARGGLVNPIHEMHGIGHYEWLLPFDGMRATQRGLTAPEVTLWRQNGLLPVAREQPQVVWYPDRAYVDPLQQPAGQGRWEYYTVDSQNQANFDLGGPEHDYFLPAFPTAQQVWDLRQALRGTNRAHITRDVNLVWVPDNSDLPAQEPVPVANTSPPPLANSPDTSHPPPPPPISNQPPIDPTNGDPGGPHDQTGTADKAQHDEMTFRGRRIVCDRTTAQVGLREDHLLHVHSGNQWLRFQDTPRMKNKSMDWNDAAMIKHLNSFRTQHFARGKWPARREDARPSYTDEEEEWIMDVVKANEGRRPDGGLSAIEELTARFNARFGADRVAKAVYSKYSRMMDEWKEHGGRKPNKKRRGVHKKEEAERNRKEKGKETNKKRKRSDVEGAEKMDEDEDAEDEDDGFPGENQ